MTDRMIEFDCCECGIHIIRFAAIDTQGLCAQCLCSPGWFRDPRLRELLDPEGMASPPEERAPS